jgi:NAD(P)-dependent dehydrogenase (short-subunit alcohol dehydrogenase family)
MPRLQGKVALISGAARGQGRSHAVRLAEEGARIIGFDLCRQIDSVAYPMPDMDDLLETQRLVEAAGSQILIAQADVRDEDGVATVVVNDEWDAHIAANPAAAGGLQNLLPVQLIDALDVSNAIVWLASDEARYVTGVALPVDAGFLTR